MRKRSLAAAGILAIGLFALYACSERATLPLSAGIGPDPQLPPPHPGLLPTVNVAPAKGWPAGARPTAPGLVVTALATGLDHPRWLLALPNNDVLVAETDAPVRPRENAGLKGYVAGLIMKRAGAGTPSPNRIILLRPQEAGEARKFTLLANLNSPFGMVLVDGTLYVADTDALLAFPFTPGQTAITAAPRRVTDLPAGPINHHWTKNVTASPDGTKLYVSIGSNSNVAENGIAAEAGRADIWEVDPATGVHRPYATGLRNPVGMGWEPATHALWTSVNERDEIGSDLVPDYMTQVHDGAFYGWPYSYYGQHTDARAKPPQPQLVAASVRPDYALGPHTASLGLAFARPGAMGPAFSEGAFVGQHGSWNRVPRSGYKVIYVPFKNGRPNGPPVDVLTGFLDSNGNAQGRPVGVTLDRDGALLVADDVGNAVWRVSAK